jgi:alkylation response protein AidB-like acyl-CoA dehydrogenase
LCAIRAADARPARPEEHDAFRATVRTFVAREVLPNLEAWDEARLIGRKTWLAAGKQGIIGLSGPQSCGGAGVSDFRFRNVVIEELAAVEAAKAKAWATDVQVRTIDRLLQLYGGYGYMLEFPIARAYRDARVQKIYDGTNEIMKHIIGRSSLTSVNSYVDADRVSWLTGHAAAGLFGRAGGNDASAGG